MLSTTDFLCRQAKKQNQLDNEKLFLPLDDFLKQPINLTKPFCPTIYNLA